MILAALFLSTVHCYYGNGIYYNQAEEATGGFKSDFHSGKLTGKQSHDHNADSAGETDVGSLTLAQMKAMGIDFGLGTRTRNGVKDALGNDVKCIPEGQACKRDDDCCQDGDHYCYAPNGNHHTCMTAKAIGWSSAKEESAVGDSKVISCENNVDCAEGMGVTRDGRNVLKRSGMTCGGFHYSEGIFGKICEQTSTAESAVGSKYYVATTEGCLQTPYNTYTDKFYTKQSCYDKCVADNCNFFSMTSRHPGKCWTSTSSGYDHYCTWKEYVYKIKEHSDSEKAVGHGFANKQFHEASMCRDAGNDCCAGQGKGECATGYWVLSTDNVCYTNWLGSWYNFECHEDAESAVGSSRTHRIMDPWEAQDPAGGHASNSIAAAEETHTTSMAVKGFAAFGLAIVLYGSFNHYFGKN